MSDDVTVTRDVMVAMRDGVRLATDVYRPDGATPLPVLLNRTPYDKADAGRVDWARGFARRGYAVVVQNCRGCDASEGDPGFLFPEAEDGWDTLAWLRTQPWCDGRVGTWGTSWESWAQTALAALDPPGLAAIVPCMSGANGFTSSIRHGGALELRWQAWTFVHAAQNIRFRDQPGGGAALHHPSARFGAWLTRGPLRAGVTPLAHLPPYERMALELADRTADDDFWRHPAVSPLAHVATFADVPTLLVGGWYDSYARGTCELFTGLAATRTGPVRLVMGPWVHGQPDQPYAGDVWFGADAAIDAAALHTRWFDRWLRGEDNGAAHDPPVHIFVMGGGTGTRGPGGRLAHGGHWRDEREWPLARTEYTPFYLHADGTLGTTPPTGEGTGTTYRSDPADPVPTIGGNISSLTETTDLPPGIADPRDATPDERTRDIVRPGGFDQREAPDVFGCTPPYLPLASRPDVLVFQTAPLAEAIEVTGPVEVRLWVGTTAPDTDFTAKLLDVYPPSASFPHGYALNLTDSVMRLSHHLGRPAIPGEVVELTITLYPTSNVFAAGHRIRLDVASSNFPRFDRNPQTGEPPSRARRHHPADNTVHHDGTRPSQVLLPVIP